MIICLVVCPYNNIENSYGDFAPDDARRLALIKLVCKVSDLNEKRHSAEIYGNESLNPHKIQAFPCSKGTNEADV